MVPVRHQQCARTKLLTNENRANFLLGLEQGFEFTQEFFVR